jgi:hypothetical protein
MFLKLPTVLFKQPDQPLQQPPSLIFVDHRDEGQVQQQRQVQQYSEKVAVKDMAAAASEAVVGENLVDISNNDQQQNNFLTASSDEKRSSPLRKNSTDTLRSVKSASINAIKKGIKMGTTGFTSSASKTAHSVSNHRQKILLKVIENIF